MFGLGIEAFLGKPTIHIPINMIIQEADASTGKYWGVWQCQSPDVAKLQFGSTKTHQLVIADAFIRPQLVADSDAFIGNGAAHLATTAFMEVDKWDRIYNKWDTTYKRD